MKRYLLGLPLIALGAYGLLTSVNVIGWAVWFGGVVVAHDFILVPLVLAAGVAASRVALPYRLVLAATALAGAVALPFVILT
ncbi:hypothetical protein J5X84_35505 [Streptosporangiaceae bacterium NEAU-GS5]|nr:hypothetical protein [Streptosporangiaceae bacterium NEAU-GS5]